MEKNVLPFDFTDPFTFLALTALIFGIVMIRYVILAGLFHVIFYYWFPEKWQVRKLNKKDYPPDQFRKEVCWSALTGLIFSIVGSFAVIIWQTGYSRIYLKINDYPILWFPLSILFSMLIHETYYYWVHRWMHLPKVFKWVHKVHHDSKITSVWTAFSFHPVEGILEALIMPVIVMVIPMHYYAILIHLTIMTLTAAINHLDIEIYPKNAFGDILGKHMIGATHHSHHHKFYRYNFGLYFTFWDKVAKTESPGFEREFEGRENISGEKYQINTEPESRF
ncbi:Sterol desaturase/sphingolipid hydroxylase, fatty acid hydroxylase superfamily [Pseudarcicella hirudinis]|uniref:Sterol desaturase/sphingolipid hydroxylase, fatty acid hydroxylase superfamily n=1 Tax=Pseudarcicella hirudinis TaxID=1079859 RepID=A0A1I5PCM7_9BACT|nr:sterol desaturase family protein [Pseudarcicella hirudinis]SFP31852.1 Sterol desaturase/sphingolipid hydroxylase, fatty acid hydroxylase superfamily [Pseudarcicella hirudinis]